MNRDAINRESVVPPNVTIRPLFSNSLKVVVPFAEYAWMREPSEWNL